VLAACCWPLPVPAGSPSGQCRGASSRHRAQPESRTKTRASPPLGAPRTEAVSADPPSAGLVVLRGRGIPVGRPETPADPGVGGSPPDRPGVFLGRERGWPPLPAAGRAGLLRLL